MIYLRKLTSSSGVSGFGINKSKDGTTSDTFLWISPLKYKTDIIDCNV